jgi:HEAT repeat protein
MRLTPHISLISFILAAMISSAEVNAKQNFEQHIELLHYLNRTLVIAQELAAGKVTETKENAATLELRNRIENIYSLWLLRFRPDLEKQLLEKLHEIASTHIEAYVRMEAVIALGAIGSMDSAVVLRRAEKDKSEMVRKYAHDSLGRIGSPATKNYDESIHMLKKFSK